MNKNLIKTTNGILLVFVVMASVLLLSTTIFASESDDSLEFVNLQINGNSNINETVFNEDMVLTTSVNTNLNKNDIQFIGYFMIANNNGILPLSTFEFVIDNTAAMNSDGMRTYYLKANFSSSELKPIIAQVQEILNTNYSPENGDQLKIKLDAIVGSGNSQELFTNNPYPEISYNSIYDEPQVIPETNYYISDLKQIINGTSTYNNYKYTLNHPNNYPFEFTFQSNVESQDVIFKLVLDDGDDQTLLFNQKGDYIKTAQPITLSTASGITSDPIAYNYKYKFNLTDDIFTSIDDYKLVSGNYDLYLTVSQVKASQGSVTQGVETSIPREDIVIDFEYSNKINTLPEIVSYKAENLTINVSSVDNVNEMDDGYYVVELGIYDSLNLTLSYTVEGLEDVELANAVFLKYKNDAAIFYPVLRSKHCDSSKCAYTYQVSIYKSVIDDKPYKLEYRVYSANARNPNLNYATSTNKVTSTRSYSSEDIKVVLSNESQVLKIPIDHIISFYNDNSSKLVQYKTSISQKNSPTPIIGIEPELEQNVDSDNIVRDTDDETNSEGEMAQDFQNNKVAIEKSLSGKNVSSGISYPKVSTSTNNMYAQRDYYLEKLSPILKQNGVNYKYITSISLKDTGDEETTTYILEVNEPKKFLGIFKIGERTYTKEVSIPTKDLINLDLQYNRAKPKPKILTEIKSEAVSQTESDNSNN